MCETSQHPEPNSRPRLGAAIPGGVGYAVAAVVAVALFAGCGAKSASVESSRTSIAPQDDAPIEERSLTSTTEPSRCPSYAPGVKNVYWGDFHIHTSYSFDAYAFGTKAPPEDAYCFAKGIKTPGADGRICGALGRSLDRKLDFAATTDHAEFYGLMFTCTDPRYSNSPACLLYRGATKLVDKVFEDEAAEQEGWSFSAFLGSFFDSGGTKSTASSQLNAAKSMWQRIQQAANTANDRCTFTTFIGSEWSDSFTDGMQATNLHRNIIYAGDKVPDVAIDSLFYPTEKKMWDALDAQCRPENGCEALAIPHNSNASDGLMFLVPDEAQAKQRAKYEKLVEIHQIKGNSECLYGLTADDCTFEMLSADVEPASAPGYVRAGLGAGLAYYGTSASKTNPMQLGFIAATDTHNGTPGDVEESTPRGGHGVTDNTPEERLGIESFSGMDFTTFNPGGIFAVWAEENTREAIFAALKRRETYATSGPRMKVRFHQTWGTDATLACQGPVGSDTVMGGTMAPKAGAPRFVTYALKDKTKLARIDVVKVSYVTDASGKKVVKEEIFSKSALDAVNGDDSMCWVMSDAKYDPAVPTLWYARVLEKPTPRWSQYDCDKVGAANCPLTAAQNQIQERAWASPIWSMP